MKFNALDTIMLDSLKETAKKTEVSKLKVALKGLKNTRLKYEKTASKRDNQFNAKQISIISSELKSRK